MTLTVGIATILAVLIVAVTIWAIRFIASGPPPDPEMDDVREVDVPFVCTVCGMSLTVTQAHDGEITAPRHCREDMVRA